MTRRDGTGPNLFVVGAAKSGTTSLWRYLDAHPDVFMSPVKEPHFFSCASVPGMTMVKDSRAYAELFADGAGAAYRGEASPSYLWDPETPARLRAAAPNARIVVSLRDPVERAYSHYWTYVVVGLERRPFAQAVQDELRASVDFAAVPPPYVSRGYYAEQLTRYLETFGDRVHVLFFDDIARDPRRAARGLFSVLGVAPAVADTIEPVAHLPFSGPRNIAGRLAVRVPWPARRAMRSAMPAPVVRAVDRAFFTSRKPPLDRETRDLLTRIYGPHDDRLETMLARRLGWRAA